MVMERDYCTRNSVALFAKLVVSVATIYFVSYFLLMARNVPALDESEVIAFKSSFRMARTVRLGSLRVSEVSWLNYFFLPMDGLYYALAPANCSLNTIPLR